MYLQTEVCSVVRWRCGPSARFPCTVLPPPESTSKVSDPRQLGLHMEFQSVVWRQHIQRSNSHSYARRYCFVQHESTPLHVKSMTPHSAQCLSSACSPLQYAPVPLNLWSLPNHTIESNSLQRYGTSHSIPSVSSLISSPFSCQISACTHHTQSRHQHPSVAVPFLNSGSFLHRSLLRHDGMFGSS